MKFSVFLLALVVTVGAKEEKAAAEKGKRGLEYYVGGNAAGENLGLGQGLYQQQQGLGGQGLYQQGVYQQGLGGQGMYAQELGGQGLYSQGLAGKGMYSQGLGGKGMYPGLGGQGLYSQGMYSQGLGPQGLGQYVGMEGGLGGLAGLYYPSTMELMAAKKYYGKNLALKTPFGGLGGLYYR